MHHLIVIASVCPRSRLSKSFHNAPRGYCPITINTNTPNARIKNREAIKNLVRAAINLLRGCRRLKRLGRHGICVGLNDNSLDDLLLVRIEDFREVLIKSWLFVLELW